MFVVMGVHRNRTQVYLPGRNGNEVAAATTARYHLQPGAGPGQEIARERDPTEASGSQMFMALGLRTPRSFERRPGRRRP